MVSRRAFLGGVVAAGATGHWSALPGNASPAPLLRSIPGSAELLPAIGLGSWITFDVLDVGGRRAVCREVMRAFFERGGRVIDSSPMYGSAQEVIGESLASLDNDEALFSASKVWIPGATTGRFQTGNSLDAWGLERFDLLQVHNMVDWQVHLPWMREWQADGRLRHTGITTSHGRRHTDMETVIRTQPCDFVQFTYNIADREAERRLLPMAADHGKAVVINRPLQGGALFERVRGQALPPFAAEIGCANWAQFFLKFIVSHPAVSCAIPATSQVAHLHENMGALALPMPDAAQRQEMVRYFERVSG